MFMVLNFLLFSVCFFCFFFFFSSRRRHTRFDCDWSSDVCSSDLIRLWSAPLGLARGLTGHELGTGGSPSLPVCGVARRSGTGSRTRLDGQSDRKSVV